MPKAPASIPFSDLGPEAAGVLKSVRESRQPLVITEHGEASAVLLGIEEYRRAERERELLLLLARGEAEIAANLGIDLDDVLAEVDALLGDHDQ